MPRLRLFSALAFWVLFCLFLARSRRLRSAAPLAPVFAASPSLVFSSNQRSLSVLGARRVSSSHLPALSREILTNRRAARHHTPQSDFFKPLQSSSPSVECLPLLHLHTPTDCSDLSSPLSSLRSPSSPRSPLAHIRAPDPRPVCHAGSAPSLHGRTSVPRTQSLCFDSSLKSGSSSVAVSASRRFTFVAPPLAQFSSKNACVSSADGHEGRGGALRSVPRAPSPRFFLPSFLFWPWRRSAATPAEVRNCRAGELESGEHSRTESSDVTTGQTEALPTEGNPGASAAGSPPASFICLPSPAKVNLFLKVFPRPPGAVFHPLLSLFHFVSLSDYLAVGLRPVTGEGGQKAPEGARSPAGCPLGFGERGRPSGDASDRAKDSARDDANARGAAGRSASDPDAPLAIRNPFPSSFGTVSRVAFPYACESEDGDLLYSSSPLPCGAESNLILRAFRAYRAALARLLEEGRRRGTEVAMGSGLSAAEGGDRRDAEPAERGGHASTRPPPPRFVAFIHKNIPVQAGLGGASSNAAAALMAACALAPPPLSLLPAPERSEGENSERGRASASLGSGAPAEAREGTRAGAEARDEQSAAADKETSAETRATGIGGSQRAHAERGGASEGEARRRTGGARQPGADPSGRSGEQDGSLGEREEEADKRGRASAEGSGNRVGTRDAVLRWLAEMGEELGSDVPFFLLSRGAAVCTGRGEVVRDCSEEIRRQFSFSMPQDGDDAKPNGEHAKQAGPIGGAARAEKEGQNGGLDRDRGDAELVVYIFKPREGLGTKAVYDAFNRQPLQQSESCQRSGGAQAESAHHTSPAVEFARAVEQACPESPSSAFALFSPANSPSALSSRCLVSDLLAHRHPCFLRALFENDLQQPAESLLPCLARLSKELQAFQTRETHPEAAQASLPANRASVASAAAAPGGRGSPSAAEREAGTRLGSGLSMAFNGGEADFFLLAKGMTGSGSAFVALTGERGECAGAASAEPWKAGSPAKTLWRQFLRAERARGTRVIRCRLLGKSVCLGELQELCGGVEGPAQGAPCLSLETQSARRDAESTRSAAARQKGAANGPDGNSAAHMNLPWFSATMTFEEMQTDENSAVG
ncbi:hypothetical protein BESB_018550 [Besnoitia besnoiti]|uniref:GHMP kinase N-terminal domain-containing protein n=1 Tax=Besnoitia besnoiti TaxID=94643 RepID=A0A2A9MA96_BESBE|nr:hypothetical protein BESB_018550 [Besnoitia besnoiti]PFH32537.1 hypothetical protein BESB_018550 [Besnoitia besnoiti]